MNEYNDYKYCPYCGTKLDNDSKFCKNCGKKIINAEYKNNGKNSNEFEPHDIKNNYSNNDNNTEPSYKDSNYFLDELMKKLNEIDAKEMPNFNENKSLMKKIIGRDFNNKDEIEEAREQFKEQKLIHKSNLIINYPIPNNKEDMIELMIIASKNIDYKMMAIDKLSQAWMTKMEQTYAKAKRNLDSCVELDEIEHIFADTKMRIKYERRTLSRKVCK